MRCPLLARRAGAVWLLTTAVILVSALAAWPDERVRLDRLDGNMLYRLCAPLIRYHDGETQETDGLACAKGLPGLIASVKNGWLSVCIPRGVTHIQALRVILAFMRQHPAAWHYGSDAITNVALATAFPCTGD
jgi:hypothetical protein